MMIGIYKITNKLNGKSYIGQSNNIKRRWKEHIRNSGSTKNPLYLDFKKYGINNFNFEILEECELKDLDDKEIYWIKYYNTYHNGYNLTKGGQRNSDFLKFCNNIGADNVNLTSKQHLILWFLLSLSDYRHNNYYVYKNSFKIKDAVEIIGISQPTWRSAIAKLKEEGYILDIDYAYQIYVPNSYAPLNIELIAFLIKFGKVIEKGGCIVSVYSVIYKYWCSCLSTKEDCDITINQLHKIFVTRGHKDSILPFEIMMNTFQSQGLIALTKISDIYKGQPYDKYRINYVNTSLPSGLKNKGYGPDDITKIVDALKENKI